jgi:hypothetical protein
LCLRCLGAGFLATAGLLEDSAGAGDWPWSDCALGGVSAGQLFTGVHGVGVEVVDEVGIEVCGGADSGFSGVGSAVAGGVAGGD